MIPYPPPEFAHRPAREWPIPWMDKGSGLKDTAYGPEMGRLILARIASWTGSGPALR